MLNKTIPKFFVFVIFAALGWSCHSRAVGDGDPPRFDPASSDYGEPEIIGRIESAEIRESSGIAVSSCQPDVIWTHNDSGDGPFVYAMNSAGRHLGTWRVPNTQNFDWEDLAGAKDSLGKCYLYVGDIGNTDDNERSQHKIYRFDEPVVGASDSKSTSKEPLQTSEPEVIQFSYPDSPQDSETLMVHPDNGNIYILAKHRNKPSGVYRLKPEFNLPEIAKPEKVAEITVPAVPYGLLTGGEISPDGKRVILCDYFAAYEIMLPDGSGGFEDIWKQKPSVIELGERKQGEAIGYSPDGLAILATSEGKNQPIIEVKRKGSLK